MSIRVPLPNVLIGERVEWVDYSPESGDYRVYAVAHDPIGNGDSQMTLELHRQGPGFATRILQPLCIHYGPVDTLGMALVRSFRCDANSAPQDLAALLANLEHIIATLRVAKRPNGAWLSPFLSRSAAILWSKPLTKAGAV